VKRGVTGGAVGPVGDLMTTEDAARRLRRPVGTLRQWRHRGIGPRSFRVGGRVAYRVVDVEAWLAEQMSGTTVAGGPVST
jgi:hypothetical protein